MSANGYIVREPQTTGDGGHVARQQWRIKYMSGGFVGMVLHKGDTAVDFGQPNYIDPGPPAVTVIGQGAVELSALKEDGGPWIQVETFDHVTANSPVFLNRVRMGNLDGTVDFSGPAWGFAAGNDINTLPTAVTNPFSGVAIDAERGARLFNTDLTLYSGGIEAAVFDRSRGIAFRNDDLLFQDPIRYIAWYDDLGVTSSVPWTAIASAYFDAGGGDLIRQLEIFVDARNDGSG